MFTIPIVLFRCKAQRSKFPILSQISTKFSSTVALCLCHRSHLQLDNMHLHDFISVNLLWILPLSESLVLFSTLALTSICFSLHEDLILQIEILHTGMRSLCTASASIISVQCANVRSSIFCHVVIMCLLSSESVNKVNPYL